MDKETFIRLRDIIYHESGIVLPDDKHSLLKNRIQKRLTTLQLGSEKEYLNIIELDASGEELISLIDLISTNVTFFYREPSHFVFLAQQCQRWRSEKRIKPVHIWCAAASSGEEPYTIAMTIKEAFKDSPETPPVKILATDICTRVLSLAQEGVYATSSFSKMDPKKTEQFFDPVISSRNGNRIAKKELKDLIIFKRLNLVQLPSPLKGPLEMIFCRNVLIYFDVQTKQKVISEFVRLLAPGGYLVLSNTESLMGITSPLRRVENSIFQKPFSDQSEV